MFIVGLTGSLGTGKTTVAAMFAQLGAQIIDADRIAHRLMGRRGPCFRPIIEYFGQDILMRGHIDRKKIANIVFNNHIALKRLERIIHPVLIKEIKEKLGWYQRNKKNQIVFIDAALLIEIGLSSLVDVLIVVKSGRQKQIARAGKHLHITKSEILKRIRAQMPMREKIRSADMMINNEGNFKNTQKQVKGLWEELLRLQETKRLVKNKFINAK